MSSRRLLGGGEPTGQAPAPPAVPLQAGRVVAGRSGLVYVNDRFAGTLSETDRGFAFSYDATYLADPATAPVSLTLPKRAAAYTAQHLFPAFCGILAEGSLATIQCRTQRIDERDLFGRLLATCRDTIGALSVRPTP